MTHSSTKNEAAQNLYIGLMSVVFSEPDRFARNWRSLLQLEPDDSDETRLSSSFGDTVKGMVHCSSGLLQRPDPTIEKLRRPHIRERKSKEKAADKSTRRPGLRCHKAVCPFCWYRHTVSDVLSACVAACVSSAKHPITNLDELRAASRQPNRFILVRSIPLFAELTSDERMSRLSAIKSHLYRQFGEAMRYNRHVFFGAFTNLCFDESDTDRLLLHQFVLSTVEFPSLVRAFADKHGFDCVPATLPAIVNLLLRFTRRAAYAKLDPVYVKKLLHLNDSAALYARLSGFRPRFSSILPDYRALLAQYVITSGEVFSDNLLTNSSRS